MAHFGSPLDGGPIDQKRVQIGGYLRVPDRCRGYGVQPDVDAAAWPRALGTARRWPVRPGAGASCTEAAPPRRHDGWRVAPEAPVRAPIDDGTTRTAGRASGSRIRTTWSS